MFRGISLKNTYVGVFAGTFLGAFTAVAVIASVGGCGGGHNLATVNGETITLDDFYDYMQVKPEIQVILADGSVANLRPSESIGMQTLQDLIAQKLTIQLAKDEGIAPTEADIAKELDFQKKLDPGFLSKSQQAGISLEMIKKTLLNQMAGDRLLTQGIDVKPQEVDAFIKDNPDQFVKPETVELSWIVVKTDAAKEQVDKSLSSGESFSSVALHYSEDQDVRLTNGKMNKGNPISLPALAKAYPSIYAPIDKFVETARSKSGGTSIRSALGTTDWIKTNDQNGWMKIRVDKANDKPVVVIDDKMREQVRRTIARQKGAKARDIQADILAKLGKSKVNIEYARYKDDWKNTMDRYRAQNKLTSSTGAGQ